MTKAQEPRDVPFAIRLSADEHAALASLAADEGVSAAALVRRWLREARKKRERQGR